MSAAAGARGIGRTVFASPWAMLTLAPLIWGGNAVAGKLATADWLPFTLTGVRWLLATILLLPFAWGPLRTDWPLMRAHLPLLVALGALGMCTFNLLMFLALNTTSAINVSIIQASMPGLIMIANFAILAQRVRALQLAGLGLSILGVLLVTTGGDASVLLGNGLVIGDAWMLLACLFYAGYTFALRWRPDIHWMSYMWIISASAFAMAVPFAAWELSVAVQPMPSSTGWAVLGYVVVFPTVCAQVAWARGVQLVGSNRAGLFFNLIPIFGAGLAVLLLGERFAWYHAAGLALVLGGILLAERVAAKP